MSGISSIRLKDKKEKILALWEARSLKEIPSASLSRSLVLRDSLPIYLDHLSDALATNRKMDKHSVKVHDRESGRIGKLHGADRAGNTSYILSEVIAEYHILREVIFQVLETDGQISAPLRDILLDSIEQAVNDAAVEFSEVHASIQQKFIDTLSHDLKNPIAAARMGAQLILKSNRPDNHSKHAMRIVRSLDRVITMIHDLLDAGRVRAGEGISLQFSACDLNDVVRDVVDDMTSIHGSRFDFKTSSSAEGAWGCDGLRRALENLLNNAVKYGAPEGQIHVSLQDRGDGVQIAVHNDGTAIPANEIPLLFDQYRRSKSAEESSKAGWGLGLTVVKGVVDAHNGKIHVESVEGKGTTFILDLPYSQGIQKGSAPGNPL